jgi:hypothetical protein
MGDIWPWGALARLANMHVAMAMITPAMRVSNRPGDHLIDRRQQFVVDRDSYPLHPGTFAPM